jgi:hypothetical protein
MLIIWKDGRTEAVSDRSSALARARERYRFLLPENIRLDGVAIRVLGSVRGYLRGEAAAPAEQEITKNQPSNFMSSEVPARILIWNDGRRDPVEDSVDAFAVARARYHYMRKEAVLLLGTTIVVSGFEKAYIADVKMCDQLDFDIAEKNHRKCVVIVWMDWNKSQVSSLEEVFHNTAKRLPGTSRNEIRVTNNLLYVRNELQGRLRLDAAPPAPSVASSAPNILPSRSHRVVLVRSHFRSLPSR